jgi:HAD superfamily hydrolase (TIGR01509 family)
MAISPAPKAVIFDFNGVIIDDEHHHFEAFRIVLAEEGISLTEPDYIGRYLGFDDRSMLAAVLESEGRSLPAAGLDQLVERKAEAYLKLLEAGIVLFPGAAELVEHLSFELPLAINSGARRHEIELTLQRSGLSGCFSVIVSADEVRTGKPDPEGYLTACQRLRESDPRCDDLEPAQCLVIEDAPSGIEAARSAGMVCLAVSHSRPVSDLARAHGVFAGLKGLDLERLQRLFQATETPPDI